MHLLPLIVGPGATHVVRNRGQKPRVWWPHGIIFGKRQIYCNCHAFQWRAVCWTKKEKGSVRKWLWNDPSHSLKCSVRTACK